MPVALDFAEALARELATANEAERAQMTPLLIAEFEATCAAIVRRLDDAAFDAWLRRVVEAEEIIARAMQAVMDEEQAACPTLPTSTAETSSSPPPEASPSRPARRWWRRGFTGGS